MDENITNTAEESPVIVVENVVMDYRKSPIEFVRSLDDVSLSIWRGEFISLYGPEQSGKSTFLQLVGCLDRPTSGTIVIDGENVTQLPNNKLPRVRSEKFGFLFHQHHLVPTLTAIENVMLPLRYRKMSQAESERVASEWLVRVGLSNRMYHRPSELSGGEQQCVALARALVNNPLAIIADEPTGDLDATQTRELIELMRGLNYTFGQTYIIATQNEEVAEMCDRIIRLKDGKIEDDTAWHADYEAPTDEENAPVSDALSEENPQ